MGERPTCTQALPAFIILRINTLNVDPFHHWETEAQSGNEFCLDELISSALPRQKTKNKHKMYSTAVLLRCDPQHGLLFLMSGDVSREPVPNSLGSETASNRLLCSLTMYDSSSRGPLFSPQPPSSLNLTSAALNGFSLNGSPRSRSESSGT